MRKFKHKTTGYIATETNSEKNYKVSEPKNFTIPKWIVEDSVDWEEIKEFPKIISLQHINTLEIITDKVDIEAWLEGHGIRFWQIYQVAVSENEVFTLGDKVSVYGNLNKGVVNEFKVIGDNEFRIGIGIDGYVNIYINMCSIKKYKEPLFVTEDGVEIFEGDEYWYVQTGEYTKGSLFNKYPWEVRKSGEGILDLSCPKIKRFSNKETAEDWLAKNKPKNLQYYEDLLLSDESATISFPLSLRNGKFYYALKQQEPRLFYLKVLELIQQDLDDGWKADWTSSEQPKFRIFCVYANTAYKVANNHEFVEGFVYFKTRQSVEKAMELMGDKLDIIFK